MTPDEFLELADNPEHISGIYNYCDRWCERCHMTSRCFLYASMKMEDEEEGETNDMNDEAFWKKIQNSFAMAFALLDRFAKEKGIDLETSKEEDDDFRKKHALLHDEVKKTPIIQLADSYINLGKDWLENCNEILILKDAELQRALQMDLPGRKPQQEASIIKDAIDIVSYHLFQICVKMMRALSGREEDDQWAEENDFPKDSDGSAKVALIGIDRSIAAWGTLLNEFPEQEEPILAILSVLQRLVHLIEMEFPAARFFVRPGFDDQEGT